MPCPEAPRRTRRTAPRPAAARPWAAVLLAAFLALAVTPRAAAEAMLQYFNTSWSEITAKLPELAEAGYTSLWLPPPTKGSGGLSVGYDLWDPFDLGSKDQRGSTATRYGTEAELLRLVETAHRFGIRVYFDNIMNHRAFDIPGFNATTPIDLYPGMVPEDFHLRVTEEGFYRKWDNTRDWGSAWQVQNLGLADLIDIAQEPGRPNLNFGRNEGDTHPKIRFLRDPLRPEYYCYVPQEGSSSHADGRGRYVGFGPGNGITAEFLAANRDYYGEYVEDYLHRAARWLMDRTKADGLRLDAVKHVDAGFFGAMFGADKDTSDYGYLGQVQRQFNLTRGFSDANHRDTVFNTEAPRDDAMVFGEHLGEPPAYGDYVNAGMRLVDNPLRGELNGKLGNPWTGLQGFDRPGFGGFAPAVAVMHAQSHDSDYAARRELQHAFYFTREGLGLIYTDGNYQAETLGESGGAFPRHANTSFLGQWGDNRVPNLLKIHDNFARGYQRGIWSDGDFVAYERVDPREGGSGLGDQVTLVMLFNDNYSAGQRPFDRFGLSTSFPPGAYLHQYARGAASGGDSMQGFYVRMENAGNGRSFFPASVTVPRGGYFAFSWKNPDPSLLWSRAGGSPVTLRQGGSPVGTVRVTRKDGPDGDPGFNPYGLPDADPTDYAYAIDLPRVTDLSALSIEGRADGSAANILLRLDAGIDLNGTRPQGSGDPGFRDNPPALSTDTYLGYEGFGDANRERFHPELFAATDTARNVTGSGGAETWRTVIGSGTFTRANGNGEKWLDGDTAAFLYHDPSAPVGGAAPSGTTVQYREDADTLTFWAKPNAVGGGYRMWLYYTLDGSNPEGAAGAGTGTTRVVPLNWSHNDDGGSTDWWATTSVPKPAAGTELRYKIGVAKGGNFGGAAAAAWWPGDANAVERKQRMLTVVRTNPLDLRAVTHYPHADYGTTRVGLAEGWHLVRARAFLDRFGRASIYNTFTQPFYLDTERPRGEVVFPGNDGDSIGGNEYGVVIRTDATVDEVWVNVVDADPSNDDVATGRPNGNGTGFEPYVDANRNGLRDAGEPFTDLDGDGTWDAEAGASWVQATRVPASRSVTSNLEREWRVNVVNIPAGGSPATIRVRLRELSSAPRAAFATSDDDAALHVTTINRQVRAFGPDTRFLVAWPQRDNDRVGAGYVMKVYFGKNLADGYSREQLLEQFTVFLQSQESGRLDGGTALGRSRYAINYDETGDFHALAVTLPPLYNGVDDWSHGVTVQFQQPGRPLLQATRLVRAEPGSGTPYLDVVSPPEIGSDGRRFELVLADVASPTAEQRQYLVRVVGASTITALTPSVALAPEGDTSSLVLRDGFPTTEGVLRTWEYLWSPLRAGEYRLEFVAAIAGEPEANRIARPVTVLLRQRVAGNDEDGDDDDDGLPDAVETTPKELPPGNPEQWRNGDVHAWVFSGRTTPLSPDSDGDGLPDGLELGLGGAIDPAATDLAADTNGDGVTNFRVDAHPPVYNTTDNSATPRYDLNRGRTDLLQGSTTDPSLPDTDYDGLRDGREDLNVNGRVDIGLRDGAGAITAILASPPTLYNSSRIDVASLPANAVFLETDPNHPDTDGDGRSDGDEDANGNGRLDLATRDGSGTVTPLDLSLPANAAFRLGGSLDGIRSRAPDRAALAAAFPRDGATQLLFLETDPLAADTDGDGLPDGWEARHGLDPLDDGAWSLRLGAAGSPENGPAGDPDGDGLANLAEFRNGTDPRQADTGAPLPAGTIRLGPVDEPDVVRVGQVVNRKEFTDWTADDLLVLDETEGDGFNNQGGDVFPGGDGQDTSRDLTAFYARDGGDPAAGGDGRFYFRFDLNDLQPFAERTGVDFYVVIDTGNPAAGEFALPDDVDTGTQMRWEAVVAVYTGSTGAVYVDRNAASNTAGIGQDLAATGVQRRDQDSAAGFIGAHFDSELDSVEVAISRQALLDAGWNGLDPDQLNYQVFTTKPGTANSPRGAGDLGGRSDIRDSIYDDRLAEDHWRDQASIAGAGSVLTSWFGGNASNDRGKAVTVVSLLLGNHSLLPGSEIQAMLDDGAGAGFHRPFDVHEAYGAPLALQVTPTLVSALNWAAADPARGRPWRDGPAFVDRLGRLARAGTVDLLGTTFAGHHPRYFPDDFNRDNVDRAASALEALLGTAPSSRLFVPAERVLDGATLARLVAPRESGGTGFTHVLVDQTKHLRTWFGRSAALGDDGFRLQRVNGAHLLPISDGASAYRFDNHDSGPSFPLRALLGRKARSGTQDQAIVLVSDLSDFRDKARADAYDRNLRWLASRPWVRLASPTRILGGAAPYRDGGTTRTDWRAVDRGTGVALPAESKDFVDYATQGDPDRWYFGAANREGLAPRRFALRPSGPQTDVFGQVDVNGVAKAAWDAVRAIPADSPLRALASTTAHAATFTLAFHDQSPVDLRQFSTGDYLNPANGYQPLAAFSRHAQSRFRLAAKPGLAARWAADAAAGTLAGAAFAREEDVDLDGEAELVLGNDRVLAVVERLGGRLTDAWSRDLDTGRVSQLVGVPFANAGTDDETEGATNLAFPAGTVAARQTSAFKDWFAAGTSRVGLANEPYAAETVPAGPDGAVGFRLVAPGGAVAKTLTVRPGAGSIRGEYAVAAGTGPLFVRFGLSPDVMGLLVDGQRRLTPLARADEDGAVGVANVRDAGTVRAAVRGSSGATWVAAAVDDEPGAGVDLDTVPMRNQALTQQVEFSGGDGMVLELVLQAGALVPLDADDDGLPDAWEQANGLDGADPTGANGAEADPDGDGLSNRQEFLLGTNPTLPDRGVIEPTTRRDEEGTFSVGFPTRADRTYRVYWSDDLATWKPLGAAFPGSGSATTVTDDGSATGSLPDLSGERFYRVEVDRP